MAQDNTTQNDDFNFGDVEHGPSGDQQTKLRKLVQQMDKAEKGVKEKTAELDDAKKHLATYRDDLVPAHMKTMGITKQEVDGFTVSSGDVLEGSLPKDPVEKAWAVGWLDANGGGSIVDREIVITLPRNAAAMEADILDYIAKKYPPGVDGEGKELPTPKSIECSVSVHHSSLKSHAMEFVRKGRAIPLKQLGLTLLKRAKLTLVKSK